MPVRCGRVASWNVEGINLERPHKLYEIIKHMSALSVGVLCLQETHCLGSSTFECEGHIFILSGAEHGSRQYAGVGFIVAPWMRHAIKGYLQQDNRMASLRVRVSGGILTLITVYAWTNEHNYDVRHDFFADLLRFSQKCKSHGPTLLL